MDFIFEHKTFAVPAEGKNVAEMEDKIALNDNVSRFAVADGVSASLFPNIWAEIISDAFVNTNCSPEDFKKVMSEGLYKDLCNKWELKANEIENNAQGVIARRYARARRWSAGAASTLVGISIDNGYLHYFVIGDSCLFCIGNDNMSVFSNVDEKEAFTNNPAFISTYDFMSGEPLAGALPISPGWIVLMTDRIAEWFWHWQDNDVNTISNLWKIDNQEEFISFIKKERDADNLKNDDVAILIIKVSEKPEEIIKDESQDFAEQGVQEITTTVINRSNFISKFVDIIGNSISIIWKILTERFK